MADTANEAFDATGRRRLLALAEASAPAGAILPPPDDETVAEVTRVLAVLGPAVLGAYPKLLATLDVAARAGRGSAFHELAVEERTALLERMAGRETTYWLVYALTAPVKLARAQHAKLRSELSLDSRLTAPAVRERHRFEERIVDARDLPDDEEIEVDAVIVGSGAGGAPLAYRLAQQGHAVLILEEGGYVERSRFSGRALAMMAEVYRDGLTATLGNAFIPVPQGRSVGGTTTINSGTCLRTPADVMRRWRFENGLTDLDPDEMGPHFEAVEEMLQVTTASDEFLSGSARMIARGAEAMGLSHGPLDRNAPDCDGRGVCVFGCPTDAKRSTNISYVPKACEAGATIFTHARVQRVLERGGRALGVEGFTVDAEGREKKFRVRAHTTTLACGTFQTPALLMRSELCDSSGQLGRRLTIHPATQVWGRFAEQVRGWEGIPQGYGIDELVDEGIRCEGAFVPVELASLNFMTLGPRWTELVEDIPHLASFGFMVADSSRGQISLDAKGQPRARYWLNETDRRKMVRGLSLLARVFLAADAEVTYPAVRDFPALRNEADIAAFEKQAMESLRANHVALSAYHPLGTCQMGADPDSFVVDGQNETHDVRDLFVCDGSAVPGPLGVNPQVTIMALSERAAVGIGRRIERRAQSTALSLPPPASLSATAKAPAVDFRETMQGTCEVVRGRGVGAGVEAAEREVRFEVQAKGRGVSSAGRILSGDDAVVWDLSGVIDVEGVAEGVNCQGSLKMHPTRSVGTLVYELRFSSDDGVAQVLHGEKHVRLSQPIHGMTTLHTEVSGADGVPHLRGVLHFDLARIGPWLSSFRLSLREAQN